jgi:short-subunit dehydrogenase
VFPASKDQGSMPERNFAIVTGASSGIGLELAKLAAQDGYDLLLAADAPLAHASSEFEGRGVDLRTLEVDLSTFEGVDRLLAATEGRNADALFANAGRGLGHAFLEQDPTDWRRVIDTNITGTVYLVQKVLAQMVARNSGRILLTGSIAGHAPGAFQAVYHASKAFVDSFADAIGNELKETQVTVTCLKPGPTDTEFFERADMKDTKVGTMEKADPADVARTGYEAMMKGERSVVHGLLNKAQIVGAKILGGGAAAEMNRKLNEPGTGSQ